MFDDNCRTREPARDHRSARPSQGRSCISSRSPGLGRAAGSGEDVDDVSQQHRVFRTSSLIFEDDFVIADFPDRLEVDHDGRQKSPSVSGAGTYGQAKRRLPMTHSLMGSCGSHSFGGIVLDNMRRAGSPPTGGRAPEAYGGRLCNSCRQNRRSRCLLNSRTSSVLLRWAMNHRGRVGRNEAMSAGRTANVTPSWDADECSERLVVTRRRSISAAEFSPIESWHGVLEDTQQARIYRRPFAVLVIVVIETQRSVRKMRPYPTVLCFRPGEACRSWTLRVSCTDVDSEDWANSTCLVNHHEHVSE